MSRPRTNNPRDRQLNLSLTRAEEETVRARATAAGMRVVDFGRAMLLRAQPASKPAPQPNAQGGDDATSDAERLVYEQLKRIGNNVNQIARRLNATRHAPPPSLEPLLKQIRAILNRGLGYDS